MSRATDCAPVGTRDRPAGRHCARHRGDVLGPPDRDPGARGRHAPGVQTLVEGEQRHHDLGNTRGERGHGRAEPAVTDHRRGVRHHLRLRPPPLDADVRRHRRQVGGIDPLAVVRSTRTGWSANAASRSAYRCEKSPTPAATDPRLTYTRGWSRSPGTRGARRPRGRRERLVAEPEERRAGLGRAGPGRAGSGRARSVEERRTQVRVGAARIAAEQLPSGRPAAASQLRQWCVQARGDVVRRRPDTDRHHRLGRPTDLAAARDPSSQGSRTTRSGRQSAMVCSSPGRAARASRRPKTSVTTTSFASSKDSADSPPKTR